MYPKDILREKKIQFNRENKKENLRIFKRFSIKEFKKQMNLNETFAILFRQFAKVY